MAGTIDCSLPGLHMTGSGLVKGGNGTLRRVLVAASSSGTLTVYDNTAASGTVLVNAFPLTAGQSIQFDLAFQVGCYISLGGTADITAVYY